MFLHDQLFETSVRENDLHNRVPVAFPGPVWGKIGGKNRDDIRAFGGVYTRYDSAVFWQTGQLWGIFSTRMGKNGFTGFPGIGPGTGGRKGARLGHILTTHWKGMYLRGKDIIPYLPRNFRYMMA